ncbi:hypothetical protein FJZ36_00830 [Candidatus Poribacteria bacterium]|nr:hypothetical protein [Candidatus Poribacteria bacterium]
MSGNVTLEVGVVRFDVEYRRFGGDRGPAIRVFGNVDGKDTQLLRFDCFDTAPHYHYDPTGFDGYHSLDRAVVPDVVAWSLVQVRDNLRTMVKTAGYRDLAEKIDAAAVAASVPELRRAVDQVSQE